MNRRERRKAQQEDDYAKDLNAWVAEFVEGFGEPSPKQMTILDWAFRKVALSELDGTESSARCV